MAEEYTNKAGAINVRKVPLYPSMEDLRWELIETENLFGLTPKRLRAMESEGLEQGKESTLSEVLERLECRS